MTSPGSCLSWFRKVNVTWLLLCVAALSARFQLEVHAVQIPASELSLLKDIFLALNGSEGFALGDLPGDYDPLESWVAANDCSEWVGVTCDSAGHVTSIILSSDPFTLLNGTTKEPTIDATSLGGTLSPSLGSLTMLETLVIANQAVTGAIPPTLGNLTKLKTLSLGDNILYGKIPAALGALANLEYLNVTGNTLGDGDLLLDAVNGPIPESLGNLVNLQYLDLSKNNLSGIPPSSLKNLSKLTHLYLDDNKLTGQVSAFLQSGSNITHLNLAANLFSGEFAIIGELVHLQYLSLRENLLMGPIPPVIGNLASLRFLELSGNNFSSSIPQSMTNLSSLTWLNLAANALSGPITVLEKLPRLQHLELQQNVLTGSASLLFPDPLQIRFIDLSNNNFDGPFPDFGNYTNLTDLALDFNNFPGTFPMGLINLPRLVLLSLSGCNITGKIPPEIGNMTSTLNTLVLSNNKLFGEIPSTLGNLKLTYMDLSGNKLTGSIPDALAKISSLDTLYLYNNELSGEIPQSIGRLKALYTLSLAQNQLTGGLDPLLGLDSIGELDVSNNSLSGQIPLDFGNFEGLISLGLSYNDFDGPLPYTLGNLSSIETLNVRGCNLVGVLPAEIGYLEALKQLDLSYNSFSGTLPNTFFTNFTSAEQISMSNNAIRGDIPDLSGMSTTLTSLDLSSNQFSGGVYQAFPPPLISLNLSTNFLEGNLSFFLHQLKDLDIVNLESNFFQGAVPFINASVVLLSNNSLSDKGSTFVYEKQNRSLQLAGNPICDIVGFANQTSCKNGGPVQPYKETPPPCTAECINSSNNAVNPYLYSLDGTCECAGLVSMTMTISQSSYAVFTDVARDILREFFRKSFAVDQRQVFVEEATAQQDGTLLVQLQLFSDNLYPLPDATLKKILAYWPAIDTTKGPEIGSLGFAKRPLTVIVPLGVLAPVVPGGNGNDTSNALVLALAIACPLLLLVLIGLAVAIIVIHKKSSVKQSKFTVKTQEHFVRPIPLTEIRTATNNFSKLNMLGSGGYGTVYRGVTKTGEVWAIKRAKTVSQKGIQDFEREVGVMSKMAHRNIVRLLGFCDENNEQIFVYEFMGGGTLKEKLRNKDAPNSNPMSFAERVSVALDAAQGLQYLHEHAQPTIIHRDVKSDNILLGTDGVAKVADFGLLKDNTSSELLNTRVAGTVGYIDPEYYTTFQVTTKSDVYSFGVVLLELITGLGPLIKDESIKTPGEPTVTALANWVTRFTGDLESLVDPRLSAADYDKDAMTMLVELAQTCTARCAITRPSMKNVAIWLNRIKNRIDGVSDETAGDSSSLSGDTSSRAAPIPASVYSGSGSASQSYYMAPVSQAYEGR